MVILIKNLDYVASAKYDYLRAFPENLKHLFSILTNIWRFKATNVIWFKTWRKTRTLNLIDDRVLVSSCLLVINDSV